jgi:hypothetical protein
VQDRLGHEKLNLIGVDVGLTAARKAWTLLLPTRQVRRRLRSRPQPPALIRIGRFTANGPQELNGDVLGSEATSVRVDYQDGGSVAVPLTTISTPINAGFFVFDIPMAHRVAGHRPAALTALAADGSTVATKQLSTSAP